MDNVIIIRYAEIHLKGLNRPFFEKALVRNVESALAPIEGAVVRRGESRVYVENVSDDKLNAALDILGARLRHPFLQPWPSDFCRTLGRQPKRWRIW